MLSPVELSLSASCFDALAWSPDGDLAVAAGEHVQILTLKNTGQRSPVPQGQDQWNITRIRVNLFTNTEWQPIKPQNRDDFSIAAEQSTSTVVGIAWSPPGLGCFRRSVLAVLTSNLLLSLWEPVGVKGQWTRVAIVNHAFHLDPSAPGKLDGLELRRSNIRSFQWCPPLHAPPSPSSNSAPGPETRWGVHFLMATNDSNEILLLRIRRLISAQNPSLPYSIEKLALYPVDDDQRRYPAACSGSLLQSALHSKARVLSVSCGPWLEPSQPTKDSASSAVAMVAAVFGTLPRVFKITVALHASDRVDGDAPKFEARANFSDHPLGQFAPEWTTRCVNGPLKWAPAPNHSGSIVLFVATNIGLLTVSIPRGVYDGSATQPDQFDNREWPLSTLAKEDGEGPKRFLDPISAMTALCDETCGAWSLHMGTTGGLGAVLNMDDLETDDAQKFPRWSKLMEDRLEQFDLNHDLGGQSVARVWGLASRRGVIAVLFSKHPTDMIEYRITSDDKSTIVFASEDPDYSPDVQTLFAPNSSATESWSAQDQREAVIVFLLSSTGQIDKDDKESQRLIYASACCAIVDQQGASIRSQARQSFEQLANLTGADLNEEISKCSDDSVTISAKSIDQLSGPGAHLFERCEICEAGIAWASATEAQCAGGHLFARCGLTFLAIQEPGISKYCSLCQKEYINEEIVARSREGSLSSTYRSLFEAFDTCLYCRGKFQAGI
ncbi:uncharacterized protein N7482_000078 [Penicillium canariense]|uniref:Transcription factor IIIC subunit delta N-term-domain-containing protein n=1 Tax=Penicillium canariense TaxID=189055 RepID=A0A9W9LRT1_9EURO|nr:uncharacterized protein N7482_000078 [Penicillium canariense]KAJ5174201.1 hypothetical protein N7482_000078 [Penicillium canariense]